MQKKIQNAIIAVITSAFGALIFSFIAITVIDPGGKFISESDGTTGPAFTIFAQIFWVLFAAFCFLLLRRVFR